MAPHKAGENWAPWFATQTGMPTETVQAKLGTGAAWDIVGNGGIPADNHIERPQPIRGKRLGQGLTPNKEGLPA